MIPTWSTNDLSRTGEKTMNVLLPIYAIFYWILGDGAPPNLSGFEDIPGLFISLFQMFWPLVLVLVFIGMILTILEVASPGSTSKVRKIFKL